MQIWTSTIYQGDTERETIPRLTVSQKMLLMEVFNRNGTTSQPVEYNRHRKPASGSEMFKKNR